MSNIVPSAVQTGVLNGCNEIAQKLYGSRLKGRLEVSERLWKAPLLAEKASSEDHSL